jgi:CheY-like chemotaxis protein
VEVDPTRLSQVIANLLNNSAKYTPPGGRIELSARAEAGELVIRVTDNGVGIPADMLPRVFDLFVQVGGPSAQAQGGLGIGLTLVRGLVELHGGSIVATSDGPGRGTSMTVRLPLARPAEDQAADDKAELATPNARRILVVDDNVDAAASMAMLLELDGHVTQVAHSGHAALEKLGGFEPELVLLDIGLPDMSGYEVATRIRAMTSIRMPYVVALTGWGSDDDRRKTLAAGFHAHLVKPVDPGELGKVLELGR